MSAARWKALWEARVAQEAIKPVFAATAAFIALTTAFVLLVVGLYTLSAAFGLVFLVGAGYALYELDQIDYQWRVTSND